MEATLFTKIVLDKPRKIQWTNKSVYRLQRLKFDFSVFNVENMSLDLATLCDLIWAVLTDPDPKINGPEDVSGLLGNVTEERFKELSDSVTQAITLAIPKDAKNVKPSGTTPTPASDSASPGQNLIT